VATAAASERRVNPPRSRIASATAAIGDDAARSGQHFHARRRPGPRASSSLRERGMLAQQGHRDIRGKRRRWGGGRGAVGGGVGGRGRRSKPPVEGARASVARRARSRSGGDHGVHRGQWYDDAVFPKDPHKPMRAAGYERGGG
jgi:hypothetical protein